MKLEYLKNTSSENPKQCILRLYDFDAEQASQFRDILVNLANGSIAEFDLSDLPFVIGIDGCKLILKAGSYDYGILPRSYNEFVCILTKVDWESAAGLIGGFCSGNTSGYQWLLNLYTDT
jgi:hypothetical protein